MVRFHRSRKVQLIQRNIAVPLVAHIQRGPRQRVVMDLQRRTPILEKDRHRILIAQRSRRYSLLRRRRLLHIRCWRHLPVWFRRRTILRLLRIIRLLIAGVGVEIGIGIRQITRPDPRRNHNSPTPTPIEPKVAGAPSHRPPDRRPEARKSRPAGRVARGHPCKSAPGKSGSSCKTRMT